jgi:hypothetical protein
MRKGNLVASGILTAIIFLVAAIVILIIYNLLFTFTKSEFSQKECQTSLLLTRNLDARGNLFCVATVDNPIPLKCSRRFLSIRDDGPSESIGMYHAYDAHCPTGLTDTDGNCAAQNAVADEMAYCWQTFYEGEQRVFQQMEINSLKLFSSKDDATACFVCSEVTLKTQVDVTQFTEYLQRAKMDSGKTYYEYFNSRKAWCAQEYMEEDACWTGYGKSKGIEQDTLKTGQKYAVVFIRRGMASCDNEVEADTTLTTQHLTNTVQIIPAADIAKHCNMVIA